MVQGVESLIEALLHPLEALVDSVEPSFHLGPERGGLRFDLTPNRGKFLLHLSPNRAEFFPHLTADRAEFFPHLAADRFELGSHLEMQSIDLPVEVVHPVVGPALSHRLHFCTVNVAASCVARRLKIFCRSTVTTLMQAPGISFRGGCRERAREGAAALVCLATGTNPPPLPLN